MANHPDDAYCHGVVPWETPEEEECPICYSSMTEDEDGIISCGNINCNRENEDEF